MQSKTNNLSGSKSDELIAPELVDPIDKLIAAILANAAQEKYVSIPEDEIR